MLRFTLPKNRLFGQVLRVPCSMSDSTIYHSLSHIFFEVRDRFIWELKLCARCCCQRLQVSQKNMKSEMAAKCLTRRRSDPGDRDSWSDLQTQVTLRSSQRRARPAIANQDSTH